MEQMRLVIFIITSLIYATEIFASVKIKESSLDESRTALIIGNSQYKGTLGRLTNPIHDAQDMRDILHKKGFHIIYRENIGKREMREALGEFYQNLEKGGGVGLFYFSGHGLEVDGQNYLIPIDADIQEKSDTEFEAIPLNQILKRLEGVKNRFNIVVLDACRNDPFSRAIGTGGLAKIDPPIGLFVSYSTGAGSVASDGKFGENGLFTKYLIENINRPLNIQQVFKRTREDVYRASNNRQFPAIYDQTIRGEFYFTLPRDPMVEVSRTATLRRERRVSPQSTPTPTPQNRWSKEIFNGKRSYSQNSPNTVRDNYTDLIWTRGDSEMMSWDEARNYCENLTIDGYQDWDLPTKRELQYLSNTNMEEFPAIDTKYFKVKRTLAHYWTKTEPEHNQSQVFGINFLFGTYDNYPKGGDGFTFCVTR
jgi:hypothetical protein